MKNVIKNIKSYLGDTNNKAKLYFGFYLIFFALLLLFIVISNNTSSTKECPKQKDTTTVDASSNYSYRYEIDVDNTATVLSGSRYGNESTMEKRIDDAVTQYYIYYGDTYILNKDNTWQKFNGNIIENFDNNLLNINYVNDILKYATQKSKSDSKVVFNSKSGNIEITVYYNGNNIDSIKIVEDTTTVKLSYYDIGKIKEADVSNDELNTETTPKESS